MRLEIRLKEPPETFTMAAKISISQACIDGVGVFHGHPDSRVRAMLPWSNILTVVEITDA